jgi:hypothetical protein
VCSANIEHTNISQTQKKAEMRNAFIKATRENAKTYNVNGKNTEQRERVCGGERKYMKIGWALGIPSYLYSNSNGNYRRCASWNGEKETGAFYWKIK